MSVAFDSFQIVSFFQSPILTGGRWDKARRSSEEQHSYRGLPQQLLSLHQEDICEEDQRHPTVSTGVKYVSHIFGTDDLCVSAGNHLLGSMRKLNSAEREFDDD